MRPALSCLVVAAVLAGGAHAAPPPPPKGPKQPVVTVETLLATERTILGQDIVYPPGEGRVTAEIITVPRGASTVLHAHPVPMFAYILDGELTVEYESEGARVYRKGDTFVEAIDWPHRGSNLGKKVVKILVVYAGAVGTPNSEAIAD